MVVEADTVADVEQRERLGRGDRLQQLPARVDRVGVMDSRKLRPHTPIPSGTSPILISMGELSDHPQREFERFATIWLAPLVAVLLRAVHDAALAYDLATEALAAARSRWDQAADPNETSDRSAWLIELGGSVLADAAEHKRVPSVERRRRGREPTPHTLTIADQQEMAQLAEARLELSPAAVEAAEALARTAPPHHVLGEIHLSGLVNAQPLPDHERDRHES
ncbi:MAG: hypothetical protein QOF54_810 [Solirubrobacteraceae bacterium]|nr:hypothetical protein [Solirubrobacteraceae bacterium]